MVYQIYMNGETRGWNQCLSHSSHRMFDFAPIIYAGLPHSPPKGNILVDESPWWRPWILGNIVSLLSAEFVQLNTVGPTVSKFIGYLWIWLHWQMGQKSSGSIYNTGCPQKNQHLKAPSFYKFAYILSVKMLHIWKVGFVSCPTLKKSFQYNTYLLSYGQNDISTDFPFWPRKPYINFLPMVDWCCRFSWFIE